jgi:hypothetical protein
VLLLHRVARQYVFLHIFHHFIMCVRESLQEHRIARFALWSHLDNIISHMCVLIIMHICLVTIKGHSCIKSLDIKTFPENSVVSVFQYFFRAHILLLEQGALIDIDRAFQQLFHGLRMLSSVLRSIKVKSIKICYMYFCMSLVIV